MKVRASAPYFFVDDIVKSVRYYVDVLGFQEPKLWGEPPNFAMPSRDGFVIMLSAAHGHEINPKGADDHWDAYFWCEGIEAYLEEIRIQGADIIHDVVEKPYYGMREIAVRDPDGHMLVFAEDMTQITTGGKFDE